METPSSNEKVWVRMQTEEDLRTHIMCKDHRLKNAATGEGISGHKVADDPTRTSSPMTPGPLYCLFCSVAQETRKSSAVSASKTPTRGRRATLVTV